MLVEAATVEQGVINRATNKGTVVEEEEEGMEGTHNKADMVVVVMGGMVVDMMVDMDSRTITVEVAMTIVLQEGVVEAALVVEPEVGVDTLLDLLFFYCYILLFAYISIFTLFRRVHSTNN